jgi:enamine deaminase RidA (YjgF/YER057c/UK114 family)
MNRSRHDAARCSASAQFDPLKETTMQVLLPAGWPRPKGYVNGVAASGRQVFIAGMVGWDAQGVFASDGFADQARQALANIVAVLREAGGKPEHIVRMTWYITDKKEYLGAVKEVGAAYRELIGRHYPTMAVVQVVALMEDGAKVEIETTAVVP